MKFKTLGNRNAPAVLFFHAMGVTGESSEPVANYLQDRYFCILPTSTVYCKGQKYVSKADEIRQVEAYLKSQGVERLELVVASSIGADLAMAFLTGTKLPIGHVFFDGGQFAQIGKGTRRMMTPFLYLAIKSLYWSKGGTLKKILWCDDDSIKPYFIAAGKNLTYTNLRRQILDSLEDKPFPALSEELQKHLYFEFGSIEDHFKYRQAVIEAYPCGHHNVCRELKVLGCIVDGIFQEYVVMPRSQVYEYDASKMTYQQAALCEPFTIGLQANWRGDVRPGDVVLVHGGGPIGLIVANIAKSRGATVIVSEPNESRLAMAKDFGADYSINPMKEDLDAFINKLTDGEGVNVIFEAAGVPALLAHATSQLSPAGRLVAMTFGKEPIPVNFKEINAKELTILGTRHQYQKFPEVVKILPDHLKEVDEITTHVFKAEDFQKAFDTLADRNSGAGKVVLTFA